MPDADWLDGLPADGRRAARAVRRDARRSPARTEYEGVGEGGDRSLVIDRAAEDIVFDELEALHARRRRVHRDLRGARRGRASATAARRLRVVIDPIDGSLNARRTLPSFALSVAVASGRSMADVEFGFVHDFGAGEEFTADRGRGRDARRQPIARPRARLRARGRRARGRPSRSWIAAARSTGLAGKAYRSAPSARSRSPSATSRPARFDGMLSGAPCRSVDVAAAQLIAREAGASVEFDGLELAEAHLDLDARYDDRRRARRGDARHAARGPARRAGRRPQ